MRLATLKDGSRDGQLILVSRDLRRAHVPDDIAPTLQRALDDWGFIAPQLADRYELLNRAQAARAFDFDAARCMAPLPRAYQWAGGSAYVNHVERLRRARAAPMPASVWHDPLMAQGGSDNFLGACDDARFACEDWGIDFQAELAVVTDDVPMGVGSEQAAQQIRLLLLVNGWSLRNLAPAELAKGFGFFQSKPAAAFAPVAVTPDELGDAWRGARVHRPVLVHWNGRQVGVAEAGEDMVFDFGRLIAHATKTRRMRAGGIVGSGPVSNQDPSRGYACVAEARALEMIVQGRPQTAFMKFGDRIRIEMLDAAGASIFGAIDQQVLQVGEQAPPSD